MATSKDAATVDREWREEATARLGHGDRVQLAKRLGLKDSTRITKVLNGTLQSVGLVIALSKELGILPPRSWFTATQYRWLEALQRAETVGQEIEVEALTRRVEEAVAALVACGVALGGSAPPPRAPRRE